MYKVRKVAQMAAYFLYRAGGSMHHAKLMKLMYLADRRALATYRFPISDDSYLSMKRGPALEKVLDLFEGIANSADQAEWDLWICKKDDEGNLKLTRELKDSDFNLFAYQEMVTMAKVYDYFGAWDWEDLVDYTYDLKEWDGPGEDSEDTERKPLSLCSIFEALREAPTTKPLMTKDEAASYANYLTEIEPNIKIRYAEAMEALLNV